MTLSYHSRYSSAFADLLPVMEIFGKLFGSEPRVKILRLFLFNPDQPFSAGDIATRAKVSMPVVRHEIALLKKVRLIKGKRFARTIIKKQGKRLTTTRKKEGGWILDSSFPYLLPLRTLLLNTVFLKNDQIIRRLGSAGKLKLIIISGVFTEEEDSRVDLLIVGDGLRRGILDNTIKVIESEIGKELRYSAFETGEFNYRLSMYDKLIRDILDYPHKKILDRLGIDDRQI